MYRFVRIVSRLMVFTIVGLFCASSAVAAQSGADLEVFLQKFPITDGEPPDSAVTYYIDVWNYGPVDAENVVLEDVLPPGAAFVSTSTAGCSYNNLTRVFGCQVGTLDASTGFSADLVLRTPTTPTTMVNTAHVSSTTPDPNPANNSMSLTIEVVIFQFSDLAVTMTASPDSVRVHEKATFTSTITNNGPSAAASVTWTAAPPFLADIVSVLPSQGFCTTTPDQIVCQLGPIAPARTATVRLGVKPQTDGFILTFASVTGEDDPAFFDLDDSNNFVSAVVNVDYPGNADPAFTMLVRRDIPTASFIDNPCGAEVVAVNGTLHQVVTTTTNHAWTRTRIFTSYQDLNGVGLTSGTTYGVQGISKQAQSVYFAFYPRDYTTVDNFKLIPRGGGATLIVHQNTHVTIHTDGSVTATVDNARLECK